MALTKVERLAVDYLTHGGLAARASLIDAIEARNPGAFARAEARKAARQEANRYKGNPPAWAKRLMKKHAPDGFNLTWRRSRTSASSSGHCDYYSDIVVTAGAGRFQAGGTRVGPDEGEQRVVLLHEIAHALTRSGHDERFWDRMVSLCKAEGVVRAAAKRDSRNFKAAMRRARRGGVA